MTEREIFLAAMEMDDPADRVTYLDQACGADFSLRQRVETLLRSYEQAAGFMEVPVVEQLGGSGGLEFLAPSQKPGSLGRLDQYEILEVVGRGGMGIVFRAFDTKLHRVVALKALAPQLATSSAARQRFVREARAAAAVTHDHIIAIHSVEDAGPVPYLVMQYIDGPTLQKKLDRTGQLPLKEILRIGLQIAEGLAAAHRQGLIHRDVKPANILLENGVERVKLTDFGLARAGDDASLTHSGVVAGTPMYMSPEQADGLPVDCRSDLFSLGSVLHTICTGRPPFRAPTPLAVLRRVCEQTPRPIREINPELPSWLEELVARLHAKAPADRFASAREVADRLAQGLAELQQGGTPPAIVQLPSAKPPAQTPALAPPRRPRRRWQMAAAVLLALFAGLGLSEATGITNVRGTVIRLFSPQGTLVIEVDDPGISVSLNGEELVITGAGVREIRLKPGKYEMKAMKEGKLIRQKLVTVTKDGRQVVRVSREPAPALIDPEEAAWEQTVAALPGAEQVKAVAARLKKLNPGFDGNVLHMFSGEDVSGLQFSTNQVTNIAPVRVLPRLFSLDLSSSHGKLADLSPLKDMRLTRLSCTRTRVADLSPLKGMTLKYLECGETDVSDLTPLKDMPLERLHCQCALVSDLSPLQGMRLDILDLSGSGVTDLSPLREMPLTDLNLHAATRLSNLSPLKGIPLKALNLGLTSVTDVSPLKNMKTLQTLILDSTPVADLSSLKDLPLKSLRIQNTKVSDLAPLKGMPLKQLWFDYQPGRDAELLRSLKDLEQINGKPAREFYKTHEE